MSPCRPRAAGGMTSLVMLAAMVLASSVRSDVLTWQKYYTSAVPNARHSAAAAYDPVRHQLIVNGGNQWWRVVGETWRLSLDGYPEWHHMPYDVYPLGRYGHTLVHDAEVDKFVRFGGYDYFNGVLVNDVWILAVAGDSAHWGPLAVTGAAPAPRDYHTAVWDTNRNQMIVFGGEGSGGPLNDVWILGRSGSPQWTQLIIAGDSPSARFGHCAVFDATTDRMLVFGGNDGGRLNDMWSLTLDGAAAWSRITTYGGPPEGRYGASLVMDEPGRRLLLFGGWAASGVANDVWQLDLATMAWSRLTYSGDSPGPRLYHAAVLDPIANRMIVAEGSNGSEYSDGPQSDTRGLTLDAVTETRVAVTRSSVTESSVTIEWYGSDCRNRSVAAVRRRGSEDWQVVGRVVFDATGFGQLSDMNALQGYRYTYALELDGMHSGETTIDIPAVPARESVAFLPSPAVGRLRIGFELARAGDVRIEAYDVLGRSVAARSLRNAQAGTHRVGIDGGDLPTGVYLVRLLSQSGESTVRGVLVR